MINSKKTEELIAYLLCSRGTFVSKQKIAMDLWGDLPAPRAMDNLYKTYKRLNNLSLRGIPLTIENLRGKLRLPLDNIECDLFMFEELYKGKSDINKAEMAVALYRGPLLFDDCYAWTSILDAYYDIRYQELLDHLILYFKKLELHKKSAYFLKNKLEQV